MKKKYLKFGFTLIELMIATTLLITLSVVTAVMLKNTLDSTVSQKTQQSANNNAKAIMSAITTDLQSSVVIKGKLNLESRKPPMAGRSYNYPSSVIFPPHSQKSSFLTSYSTGANNLNSIGNLTVGNDIYTTNSVFGNYNKLIFYTQRDLNNFNITEYVSVLDNDGKGVLYRNIYNWTNPNMWAGITGSGASGHRSTFAIDGECLRFSPYTNNPLLNTTNYFNMAVESMTPLIKLPNVGDVIYLRTERTLDNSNEEGVNINDQKFAPNHYNLKVIVFQTNKSLPLEDTRIYFAFDNSAGIRFNRAFFELFTTNFDNLAPAQRTIRRLYKFCELNSSVSVRTSSEL